jgi:hypothetical protein
METRTIKLTESAFKYGNLNLRACGKDFFPPDVFGGPNKKSGLPTDKTLVKLYHNTNFGKSYLGSFIND